MTIDRLLVLEEIPAKVKLSLVMLRKIDEAKPLPQVKSHCTGHMLLVDTFYVCRLKGVGRIYQFTAIDTARLKRQTQKDKPMA